ncbi:hypothetical protein GUG22_18195, partial [Xanthomonas citri pv. citri]|nr:hypothetical protein [Xanthomonas citri pv. citri]
DLTEKIEKIKKAKFSKNKLGKFIKDKKDLDYVENLKDEKTFKILQDEFTEELKFFLEDLNERLEDIKENKIENENAEDFIAQNKELSELVKTQFDIFEKVS